MNSPMALWLVVVVSASDCGGGRAAADCGGGCGGQSVVVR